MKTSLLFRAGAVLLLGFVGRSVCLPIDSVPYKGAVDYAGYPATDPSKAYPQPPAPAGYPFGFQPTGKPVLRINTNVGKTPVPVIPPLPKGWPDNLSPLSSSGSSTLISPSTPGGRSQPRRQQTLYEAKNRPPTPFARPAAKKQATLPAGHWHPSMGMGPRPVTPTEPFIPPGFSDKKPNPNQAASKPSPPKKPANGYEADNERGRLRKTKGLAAPGYGSDSDSSSPERGGNKSAPRKVQGMQATPGSPRRDSARPGPGITAKRAKGVSPPPSGPKPGGAKPPAKKVGSRTVRPKDGTKLKAVTRSTRKK